MKIIQVTATNFCSYPSLTVDLDDKGLCLISGDTGAGKSTVLDAVSWCLFNTTSKEMAADDVRTWDTSDQTEVRCVVELETETLWVYRTRAPNDLFFTDGSPTEVRGKDLTDTQRLLEARLGVTAELFHTGSYLSQFSKADSFFVAKAKDRREVLELITDQEFPIKLAERTSIARKDAKKEADRLDNELAGVTGKLEATKDNIQDAIVSETQWTLETIKKIQQLEAKQASFEEDKARTITAIKKKSAEWQAAKARKLHEYISDKSQIDYDLAIHDWEETLAEIRDVKCEECGGAKNSSGCVAVVDRLNQLKAAKAVDATRDRLYAATFKEADPHLSGFQQAQNQQNPYGEQIEVLKAETNPHTKRLQDAQKALQTLTARRDTLQASLIETNALVASLTWLYDKSFEMRGLLMERVVAQIETATNACLEKHFDAPIRVKFSLSESDKLDVEITNNGHVCGFKSLSGGERCLLKLSFSLSLMRTAQDKAGIQFHQLFLDEPLAGLDPDLKVKAFGLFQELEQTYGSVFVIEHAPEFTAQFTNVYNVTKTDGRSELHEARSDQ